MLGAGACSPNAVAAEGAAGATGAETEGCCAGSLVGACCMP